MCQFLVFASCTQTKVSGSLMILTGWSESLHGKRGGEKERERERGWGAFKAEKPHLKNLFQLFETAEFSLLSEPYNLTPEIDY